MVKNIALIIALMGLGACATTVQQPPKIIYQQVKIPIVEVPAPPTVIRPVLPIDSMTNVEKADSGTLVKNYVISVKELENYATNLEKIVQSYTTLSKNNPVLPISTTSDTTSPVN